MQDIDVLSKSQEPVFEQRLPGVKMPFEQPEKAGQGPLTFSATPLYGARIQEDSYRHEDGVIEDGLKASQAT